MEEAKRARAAGDSAGMGKGARAAGDKPRVLEAIVVEGRYDKNTLAQVVDAPIVTLEGFAIFRDKEKLAFLRRLAEARGLILFTDSDGAGFVLRRYLKGALPGERIRHAYIPDLPGKERRKRAAGKEGKLGVEGMRPEILLDCLRRAGATFIEPSPLVKGDFIEPSPLVRGDTGGSSGYGGGDTGGWNNSKSRSISAWASSASDKIRKRSRKSRISAAGYRPRRRLWISAAGISGRQPNTGIPLSALRTGASVPHRDGVQRFSRTAAIRLFVRKSRIPRTSAARDSAAPFACMTSRTGRSSVSAICHALF